MTRIVRSRAVAVLLALGVLSALIALPLTPTAHATPSWGAQCTDQEPATRTPGNPLMLSPAPPASDRLQGANFWVAGPSHGVAAGAIAQILGIDKQEALGNRLVSFSESESWTQFAAYVAQQMPKLSAAERNQVYELEKIAAEPSAVRISAFSEGGTPVGIYAETRKIFCHVLLSDPGSIPIISTDFMQATLGGCATTAQIDAYRPHFEAQINAMAQGVGRDPAVFVAEVDAVGASSCMVGKHSLGAWESLMKYEALKLESLPHTVVYLEGGYSDSTSARYAAQLLNAAGVRHIQGFFTNDTHLEWTSTELRYGEEISKLTGGAHFIINTADNGRGPLLNPDPETQGIEDLCNPPGRGLGIRPTTKTGFPHADAFLWTYPPGYSNGSCNGGPTADTFWVARAVSLAAHANSKLGPGHASRPY